MGFRFYVLLAGVLLVGESIVRFCTWIYFSSHNVYEFRVSPLDSWLYGMGPLIVGAAMIFYFFWTKPQNQKQSRSFKCKCGEGLTVNFTKSDFILGGINTICPKCGALLWVPTPEAEEGKVVFFQRPKEDYNEYL